jgi:hypothetical protein
MKQINGITDSAHQIFHMLLDDGTVADITLNYLGATQRWAVDVGHPQLIVNNKILCAHPNILRQYQNQIPFGLMCFTNDGLDPTLISDFLNARAELFILTAAEVEIVETRLRSLSL